MTPGTTRLRLGPLDAFTTLPARIEDSGRTFFLVRNGTGFRLLSTVCPHQGGAVFDNGSCFECPLHGWRFDRMTGRSLNAPSRALASIPVTVEDGVLFADVPRQAPLDVVRQAAAVSKPGLSLHLHAHACLEISYDGFTLLTDPWLDGPAFLGAWTQYPPADASGAELRPDAILITHEHSDHFHEPTLRQFDRGTPVYVPDFPNGRLPRRLAALGFTNVTAMRFGDDYVVHEGWKITCFEPESYWNDAFALIDIEGFRIFDINDAGVNHRIARMVAPVDVLAVQFSAGASGYPWTWAHLTDDQKVAISQRACAGKLNLIREATQLYGAGAVLPFASHFTLWHESHRAYARLMKRNTLGDVRANARRSRRGGHRFVAGGNLGCRTGGHAPPIGRSRRMVSAQTATDYMQRAVDSATFAASHPADESLSREELVAYLEQLNSIPEIVHCEDLTVRIRAASAEVRCSLDVSFAIAAGRLTVLTSAPNVPNLSIDIPLNVLTAVIRNELSWDEAFIGYWCRFDRHPDVYHAGFWRLFQAPYLKRRGRVPVGAPVRIGAASTVAELLESHGPDADRILRRYGLYCSGCQHSIAESIEMAARQHGVNPARVDQLVRELNSAFGPLGGDVFVKVTAGTLTMVLLLAVGGLLLYAHRLGDAPMYLSPDEVIIAVDAHSIAATAHDVEGKFLPLYFNIQMPGESRRGWFTPMIFYFSALFYKLFPLTERTVRLPTAVLGVTNIVLMFFLARKLFKDEWLALLAAVLLAMMPAHFILSRLGLDYLYPLPFILGWLLCLASYLETERPLSLFTGTLLLGVGFYSYIASVIMMPFYLLLTFGILFYKRKPAAMYGVAAAGLALPLLLLVFWILRHPTAIAETAQRYELYDAQHLNALQGMRSFFSYAKIEQLASLYWGFFGPSFLFFSGDQQMTFSTRQVGVFLFPMALLLPFGIYRTVVERPSPINLLILVGFLSGPLAALLGSEEAAGASCQRAVEMLPFALVLLAALWALASSPARLQVALGAAAKLVAVGLLALMPLQFAMFQRDYFGEYRLRAAPWFGGNLRGALEEIIAMDRRDNVPRIYFSTLKATNGLLDTRNRWMAAYWRFYLIKQHREDLLGKTARFDAQALDTVPARSLVLANVGDVTADGLVKSGALKTVTLIDEIDRDPFFAILQR